MLDELAPHMQAGTSKDVLARLNHRKNVSQVLPAEIELGFRWMLHKTFKVEHEPDWWRDSYRPDVFVHDFLPGRPAAIEITAPSDNSISGEAAMDAIAQQISKLASQIGRSRLGDFLYFVFGETSGYGAGGYYRRVLAPRGYKISEDAERRVTAWVLAGAADTLQLIEPGLAVSVTRKGYKQIRFHNAHSSMPPEAHSVDDNPLYKLLDRKRLQIRAAPAGALRMLFVGDAGSRLLNRIGSAGERDPTRRAISGQEIISQFVRDRADGVDAVVTIVPRRRQNPWARPTFWQIACFSARQDGASFVGPLEQLVAHLPRPRFEGYQARSLFRQGLFSPEARGWYLGRTITGGSTMSITVSARGLLDLLAGRITETQFRRMITDDPDGKNIFRHWLQRGYTISRIEMAPRQIDEEDDHLIIHFSDDPAAREFKLPD